MRNPELVDIACVWTLGWALTMVALLVAAYAAGGKHGHDLAWREHLRQREFDARREREKIS
jgi:hypothetical protein